MKDTVKVVFFGKEYSIVTDAEQSYVLKVADYLERKVKEVTAGDAAVSISPPVLMASLEIIDDFFSLKREFDEFKRTADEKTRDLVRILETPGAGNEAPLAGKGPQDPFGARENGI